MMAFICSQISAKNYDVSYESLLNEITNRDAMTYFPKSNFKLLQFSSYDRHTTEINDSTWFANMDCNYFIKEEENEGRKESVLMETVGAGSIVRFWITGNNHGAGTLRIYMDGKDKPVIETKLLDFISKNKVGYPLSSSVSPRTGYMRRGHNLYIPMSYAKSCKVTYERQENEWLYYCINARKYEDGITVEPFTEELLTKNKALITKINKTLLDQQDSESEAKVFKLDLPIAQEKSVEINSKGKAVKEISLKIYGHDLKRALRDIIVKCSFDGEQTVWCPIGDFFGTGYELHSSKTYYSNVKKDGTMTVKWVMPFKNNCKLSFENVGNKNYSLNGSVLLKQYRWKSNSMYFHSTWWQQTAMSTGGNKARLGAGGCFDMNFVTINGQGVYVGDCITLFNTSLGGHWKCWWGEGDEKIYLDGENWPSIIGTGTEDYYGYAWCEYAPFNHPYLSQPIGGGDSKFDMTVNMRYRGLDVMPFNTSLKFDMEMWHWTKTRINFAPTTYFYLKPGGSHNIKEDYQGAKDKLAFARFDILEPVAENNLLEGENLKPVFSENNTNGFYGDQFSGGLGLNWYRAEVGESKTYEFYAGTNESIKKIALFSATKNGVYKISVNNKVIYTWDSKSVEKENDVVTLPKHILKNVNKIKFELVSKYEQSQRTDIVIDYLIIK
jgi:hypothetical protein